METLKEKIDSLHQNFQKQAYSLIFEEFFKNLFDNDWALDSFTFYAYIPYFNDGDECTYRVARYPEDIEIFDRFGNLINDDYINNEISNVLNLIEYSTMEKVFGVGEIRVFSNGKLEINTYDDHE